LAQVAARLANASTVRRVVATVGVLLTVQGLIQLRYGIVPIPFDTFLPDGTIEVAGTIVGHDQLITIAIAVAGIVGLAALFRGTRLGLEMRAVTQNRAMAASMGIRTARVDALTFGLGSGIAGIAGVALSQIDNVSPNLGQGYIIDSFMVVVFGGVGNLWGTLVGAMTLGIANKLLEPYAGAVLGKIILLVAIILFIQRHPRGLFALKGRAVEA
jgi:urea transport system permease protein